MFSLIFWIFILFLSLSYLGISIEGIISSPAGQENFGYLFNLISHIWQLLLNLLTSTYLK